MAIQRPAPFIWVTWLSGLMSGSNPCQWQVWFLTHNKLEKKQPSDFDLFGWKIDHTKMLTELTNELGKDKSALIHAEYSLDYRIADYVGAKLVGKADCICYTPPSLKVYECKTGKERDSDPVQVMIYMWMLSKLEDFTDVGITGEVVYNERRQPIPQLPNKFESNIEYFIKLLCGKKPLIKSPGSACKFCSITKADCPDRVED